MLDLPDTNARARLVGEIMDGQQRMLSVFRQLRPWLHLDLTMGQLKTLMFLGRQEGASVGAIADVLEISRPAASVLIDRLVQLEFVERREDAGDRRRTLVTLAVPGRELVQRLMHGPEALQEPLSRMDLDDLAALARGMQALAAAVTAGWDGGATQGADPSSKQRPAVGAASPSAFSQEFQH